MRKVLIIEDDFLFRFALRYELEQTGYEVTEARDGREARELYTQPFDLVISDYRLPDCTGLALLSEIKEQKPQRLVIILTSEPAGDGADEAYLLGANEYLEKPTRLETLRPVLEKLLAEKLPFKEPQLSA